MFPPRPYPPPSCGNKCCGGNIWMTEATYMEYLVSTNSKLNALRDGDAGNSNIMTFILYKTFIQVSKTQIISYFFTFWVYASKGTGTDWADLVFFMKSRPGMTRKWCQTAWHNFSVIQIGLTNCADANRQPPSLQERTVLTRREYQFRILYVCSSTYDRMVALIV